MKAKQFHLRMRVSDEEYQTLRDAAKRNGRTMNAELVARIMAARESEAVSEVVRKALEDYRKAVTPQQPLQPPLKYKTTFGGVMGGGMTKIDWLGG